MRVCDKCFADVTSGTAKVHSTHFVYTPNSQGCFVSQGDVYYVTSYPLRYLIAQIATTTLHYTPQMLAVDHDVTRTGDYVTLQSNSVYHGNVF